MLEYPLAIVILIVELSFPLIIGINEIIIGIKVTKKTKKVRDSHNLYFTSLSKKTENIFKKDKKMLRFLLFQRNLIKIYIAFQIGLIIIVILANI